MPQLWVIAGPNGAGKTTIADRWFAARIPVISPDYFAAQYNLHPFQAGRRALQKQEQLLREGISFAVDTTLSGNRKLALMERAANAGYKVNLIFVCLKDAALCHTRITERTTRGGHTVPIEDVVRRYNRSLSNLNKAIDLAERFFVLDNTGKNRRLLFSMKRGRIKYLSNKLPEWARTWIPSNLLKQSRGLAL
ncbi:MAG: zeta toxin family protein [Verrucomicrobia bacterium]|nr:MAG: zeta toxin family protein [Verrucomicrobiota bacterium]